MFKKLLSMLGVLGFVTRAADLPAFPQVAIQAAVSKKAPRKLSRKKRNQLNLVSRQHHIKSERQRIAAALRRARASSERTLAKAGESFSSGLYRGSR